MAFVGVGIKKQMTKWKLSEVKRFMQDHTARQGCWWGCAGDADEDPGVAAPSMAIFLHCQSEITISGRAEVCEPRNNNEQGREEPI